MRRISWLGGLAATVLFALSTMVLPGAASASESDCIYDWALCPYANTNFNGKPIHYSGNQPGVCYQVPAGAWSVVNRTPRPVMFFADNNCQFNGRPSVRVGAHSNNSNFGFTARSYSTWT